MSKIKHNKIKNTGILFELLTRQITADILEGKDNNKSAAVSLVKEFFSKNTSMGKELDLIKLLSETKYKSVTKAEQLIELTLTARKKISNSKLRNEKYNLIKKIRENYNPTDFFKTTIRLGLAEGTFRPETWKYYFPGRYYRNPKSSGWE